MDMLVTERARKAQETLEEKVNIKIHSEKQSVQKRSGCPCEYGICDECSSQGRFEPRT